MSVSQTHGICKILMFDFFDFLILDFSQNVAIYIVRCDEADGWGPRDLKPSKNIEKS